MQRDVAIPDYAPAAVVFAAAARHLLPLERIPISEAAERYRVLRNLGGGYSGPWTFDEAPYLKRPTDCLGVDDYRLVAVKGPSQSGKSTIPENWVLHSVVHDPANFVWAQADKAVMEAYVKEKINAMLDLARDPKTQRPILRDHQLKTPSSDNLLTKEFEGMIVNFIWPVPSQFRMRSAPRAVLDDFDDIPEDIGGQGSPLSLIAGRQTTFEGREKTFVGSSPSLPEGRGIDGLVRRGTDETWRVPCRSCGDWFTLDFEQLEFDRTDSPEDAAKSAHLVCPVNGCILEPRQKLDVVAPGVWAGPMQTVEGSGRVIGEARATDIASFSIDGLMGFRTWPSLAAELRAAELVFERSQDEHELRAFWNTRAGKNYRSKIDTYEPLAVSDLERLRADYLVGTVPDWVAFLTAAIDVQGNRFAVLVKGWGEGFESCLVDRYDILTFGDARTGIDPAKHPEHWGALLREVFWRRWPLADGTGDVGLLNTAIDTGGLEGVEPNAVRFWHTARQAGVADPAITLIKGGNNPKGKLLPAPTFIEVDRRGRAKKHGPRLWMPNVNAFKDIVNIRLRREDAGDGAIHFPRDLDPAYLGEYLAEEKQGLYWEKIAARNESLDLEVYNNVALLRWSAGRTDVAWVPDWARPARGKAAAAATSDAANGVRPGGASASPASAAVPARPARPQPSSGAPAPILSDDPFLR